VNEKQNISTRQGVRKDLIQYGRVAYVPEGMSDAEIQEAYGDELKKGLIKRLVSDPGRSEYDLGESEKIDPATGKVKVPSGGDRVWNAGPPSVQLLSSTGFAAPGRQAVSRSLFGPCMVEHVLITVGNGQAVGWNSCKVGLHIGQSREMGLFAGELALFNSFWQVGLITWPNGPNLSIGSQLGSTAVGWRTMDKYEFFPHVIIPFGTFYVNLSTLYATATVYFDVTVDFAPIDIPRAKLGQTVSVEPRRVAAPVLAAPKAGLEAREQLFHNYGEIKTLEALGNRIVWPTVRMTGRGDWPIAVTVVSKG